MNVPASKTGYRVLHLIDTGGPGGAETVFYRLASELERNGLRSLTAISREGWLAARLRECDLDPIIIRSKGVPRYRYLGDLLGVIRRERPDAILAHLFGASVYAAAIGAVTGVPVVSVLHGKTDLAGRHSAFWLKRALLEQCRAVVFVADSLRGELLPILRLHRPKCVVINNGVDTELFHPGHGDQWRDRLGIDRGTFLIGAVGNIRKPKAYEILIQAAALVCESNPNALFVIAGDGPAAMLDELSAQVDALGLRPRVRFLGRTDDIPGLLRALDAYVLSSRTEGLPLACLEAMATGLPIVSTRCGGPESVLEDGVSGLLVPIDDPVALADKIRLISAQPGLGARLGAKARQRATDSFSQDSVTTAYRRLLEDVI